MLISCLLTGVVCAVVGLATGWIVRARMDTAENTNQGDASLARDLLASLHFLARRVAADVDDHSNSLGDVDRRLAETARRPDRAIVEELVTKLVRANETMQRKLSDTDARLAELTTQIERRSSEARTDALTGISNRRAFEEQAGRQMDQFRDTNEEFSMLMLDIDKFKNFNDKYGHQCGDEVLRGVAHVLTECLRGRDIVTRYGGEEFGIVLPNTTIAEARRSAEQIRAAIEHTHFHVEGQSLAVTVSVGVAEAQAHDELQALVKRADQALYAAKRSGRNRVFWHDGTLSHPLQTVDAPPATDTASPSVARPAPAAEPVVRQPTTPRLYAGDSTPMRETEAATPTMEMTEDPDPSNEVRILTAEDIDPAVLKNIGNKTMFCQDIRRRIAEWNRGGSAFSVILAGIDQFEELVRVHGDAAARLILGAVAQSTDMGIRDMDVITLYNNSTIGIVLPKSPLKNALCVGERLMRLVDGTVIMMDDKEVRFSVNLGVVAVQDGDEMATLIERARAELAMSHSASGAG